MTANTGAQTELQGKIALVTGGASGIGKATCLALSQAGVAVTVADLGQARCEAVVAALMPLPGEGPGHFACATDVSEEAAVLALVEQTVDRFGRLDILVASAGILRAPDSSPMPLARISTEEWDLVLGVNLRGMFLCNREAVKVMSRQRGGDIVNISSVSGLHGRANDAPYCASKFGVMGMSESLAEEVRGYGVRVQVVAPDAVNTPIWEQNGPVPMPVDALPPERVADLVLTMLTLPPDTILGSMVIAPFKTRRRKPKEK